MNMNLSWQPLSTWTEGREIRGNLRFPTKDELQDCSAVLVLSEIASYRNMVPWFLGTERLDRHGPIQETLGEVMVWTATYLRQMQYPRGSLLSFICNRVQYQSHCVEIFVCKNGW